jgi:pyrimidine-nucleoside phosphorylase
MKIFNPVEIIRKKRDGEVLSEDEISYFISAYLEGKVADYQVSALLMAIYFNGLSENETLAFVKSYIDSGEKVGLSFINKPKVDKHSTGGVGDKTSLILAPLVACFDVVVPMMSGRGLGHTGGTLDKLESIPGFRTNLSVNEFKRILSNIGVCMIGQNRELAAADGKIYALRDVTATIDNIGLIAASIVSKKIVEGAEGIVYDVKSGSGAMLKSHENANKLAFKLMQITKDFGRKAAALITDMNEPLGRSIGNWLEVEECIDIMNPSAKKPPQSEDLIDITLHLAGAMLLLASKCRYIEEGVEMAGNKLSDGACFKKFLEIVEVQGGDTSYIVSPVKYKRAKLTEEVIANQSGYVSALDALKFGQAAVILGCGRMRVEDQIDYSAGILLNKKVGDKVNRGDVICSVRSGAKEKIQPALEMIKSGIEISRSPISKKSKILEIID